MLLSKKLTWMIAVLKSSRRSKQFLPLRLRAMKEEEESGGKSSFPFSVTIFPTACVADGLEQEHRFSESSAVGLLPGFLLLLQHRG